MFIENKHKILKVERRRQAGLRPWVQWNETVVISLGFFVCLFWFGFWVFYFLFFFYFFALHIPHLELKKLATLKYQLVLTRAGKSPAKACSVTKEQGNRQLSKTGNFYTVTVLLQANTTEKKKKMVLPRPARTAWGA